MGKRLNNSSTDMLCTIMREREKERFVPNVCNASHSHSHWHVHWPHSFTSLMKLCNKLSHVQEDYMYVCDYNLLYRRLFCRPRPLTRNNPTQKRRTVELIKFCSIVVRKHYSCHHCQQKSFFSYPLIYYLTS